MRGREVFSIGLRSIAGISNRGTSARLWWIAVPQWGIPLGLTAHRALARDCNADRNGLRGSGRAFWGGCYSRCMDDERRSSHWFGAIAHGARSTAAGWTYGKSSASAANSAALFECGKHGGDCELPRLSLRGNPAKTVSGLEPVPRRGHRPRAALPQAQPSHSAPHTG